MENQSKALSIRYEEGDAAEHQIDLNQLGESLQGFARIIAVCANYAATGKVLRHFDALGVTVVAIPVEKHHCYEIATVVKGVLESKEFWGGAVSGLVPFIIQFVFSRRGKEEMKHLSDALKKQMELTAQGNDNTVRSLVQAIDRLAGSLRPSVKKALSPVGRSVGRVALYDDEQRFLNISKEDKEALTDESSFFEHAQEYDVRITELDIHTGGCKVNISGDADRVPGQILDPVVHAANNPYAAALLNLRMLKVLAKSEIDAAGTLLKLHIVDTISDSDDVA